MEINIDNIYYIALVIGLIIVIPIQYFILKYSISIISISTLVGSGFCYFVIKYYVKKHKRNFRVDK